ncbi:MULTISPECIES: ROK family glucokinase [Thermoactinomyces]|jgi:glucokinase|uniref:Glucokinase n=1 Tax=Thermoactinomyces daqus TaxID=1329516 RepID=A0A7W1XAH6_9BACL|nr:MULTISPECIES: ROK family glucokinase [Thermoactinomyces]MBA4543036.1 ROK family glucokinase [Thermoactinomyces daqus]MBH8598697.1 ROK family glucokinase [Thermoactinomyces sp. CICC 10523]MBH8605044.1 ROK family glucokinase [Thermoactinomyces sp. CICC 10522]MBH8606300.1 ROK family glucokinase [Thermoactinomyces sp. CICC 10521]
MRKYYIGIDVGGTSMKMGLMSESGEVLAEAEHLTQKEDGPDGVIARMVEDAKQLADGAGISWNQIGGVGVGLPGFLDIPNGVVKYLTNLGWRNVPIKEKLEQAWQVPVSIDNDANVAALGEAWQGAGKGVDDLVCITLGTGVGGGVIAEGHLLHGMNGFAGEVGHIQVDREGVRCNCGQIGCLETVASATALVRMAREAIDQGRETVLTAESLSAREIFSACAKGDPVASEIVAKAIDALARTLAVLSLVLNPSRFIIGGGVAKAGDVLLNPLREAYEKEAQDNVKQGVEIVLAKLGNRAGFIGAAGLLARGRK